MAFKIKAHFYTRVQEPCCDPNNSSSVKKNKTRHCHFIEIWEKDGVKARALVKLENNNWWVETKEDTVKWQETETMEKDVRTKSALGPFHAWEIAE